MNAVTIGPLVLAADRFAVVLGIFVFMIAAGLIARRVDEAINGWSWWTLITALVAARLGHVARHWQSFADEPARALAVWEGGFYWPPAAAVVIISIFLLLKRPQLRLWALVPLALGLLVWNTTWQLTGGTRAVALPEASFATLEGDEQDFLSRPGDPKVVNLWATWCPPCRREMPMMADVAASSEEIDFIFANQGESQEEIERYLADNDIALETVLLDPFSDLSRHYEAAGLPMTLFIGPDGSLRHAHLGEISREALLSRIDQLKSPED